MKKYIYKQKIHGIESKCATHIKKNLIESKFDLFSKNNIAIEKTKNFVGNSIVELINSLHSENSNYQIKFVDSWFHIGKTNSVHEIHAHGNCSWCGIYFIQSGSKGSGETVFSNPASSSYLDDGNRYLDQQMEARIKPEDGLLVLFPSYLQHYQSLYIGAKDRIVIAFNAQVQLWK